MDHFALLWKARTIEKYRQKYENEKINSILMSESDIPEKTIFQRWRHYKYGMQKRLSRTFSKWYPEGSTVSNFFVSLGTDMKLSSILLRSLYGFVGGLLLTYLGFMFFVFQLSLSMMNATVLSSILGVLLTLGLTFSNRIRCLIFLLVPQLFSRVGRYTLTCYALVLILTGPATNTLKNSEVLSESMACNQEQIKLSVRNINGSFKKPFNSIKDSLKITINSLKMVVRKLKIALIRINRLILSIASVIQSSFTWLSSVADVCNDALGTPQERCLNTLKEHLKNNNEHVDNVERKDTKKSVKSFIENLLDKIGVKNVKKSKHKGFGIKDGKNTQDKKFKFFTKKNDMPIKKSKVNFRNMKKSTVESYNNPWFSNKANVANIVCALLKQYNTFCVPADFADETFLATIKKKLKTFVHRISTLIHVQLNIQHTYTFIGNNCSTNQVAAGIITEIRNRADPILTWLSWSSCVTSLFILLIIFRAKHYQHMFETRSRFDNRFITKEFRELDLKRLREGRATVLPLNRRERAKYVTTTSFRLVASEKFHLNRSAVFMTVTTFKLIIHIVADYSLYWVLMTIRHHGKLQSPLQPGIADTGTIFTGIGFVARLLQSFIDTLNIQLRLPPPDNSCLPNPYPPNINRYCQIGFLIVLLWFFAIFEPYGLRLRHLIMGHYRPQRAKARAVWLYNHILRTRASFMKFARRKLHREYKYSSQSDDTFTRCLQNYIPFHWLRSLLGIKSKESFCLLCNISDDTSDPVKEIIKCEVPNCPGAYCSSCFSDIGQLCTICLSPADYGDISDFSLEKGSSDEDDGADSDDMDQDDNRRNFDHGANTFEEAFDATTSRTSRIGKHSRVNYLFGKNESKCGETMPLIKHCSAICNLQNRRLDFTQEKEINDDETTDVTNRNKRFTLLYELQQIATTQVCKENFELFKDYNNNNVYAYGMVSSSDVFQFNAYEITKNPFQINKIKRTTIFAKYLSRKKIIRCKQTTVRKKLKYFMTCSYNDISTISGAATNVDNNREHVKDSSYSEENCKTAKKKGRNKKSKTTKDIRSKNDTAKSIHQKYKGNMRNINATFSSCWKNMKMTISSCKYSTEMMVDLPTIQEHKHKRKKKPILDQNKTATATDEKTEINKTNEEVGKSRIFAYLDEKDWVKRRFNVILQANEQKQDPITTSPRCHLEHTMVKNMVLPWLDLSSLTESKRHDDICNINSLPGSANQESPKNRKEFSNIESLYQAPCLQFNLQEGVRRVPNNRLPHPLSILKSVYSLFSHTNKKGSTCYKKDKARKNADVKNKKSIEEQMRIKFEDKEVQLSMELLVQDQARKPVKLEQTDEGIQTKIECKLIETENKSVEVIQTKRSCACQSKFGSYETKDFGVQVENTLSFQRRKPISQGYDVGIMVGNPKCTCAIQYQNRNKDCGVSACPRKKLFSDNADSEKTLTVDEADVETLTDSDDSRTDTTFCGHANIDFHKIMGDYRNDKSERVKLKVITKGNQSTLTDKPKNCNASTATYDWWSPIVEKKNTIKNDYCQTERKKRNYEQSKQRETRAFKSRGMTTGEKVVSFRSKTQFIPYRETGCRDIMSPSRYLLESQKYYNELFNNKFTSPRMIQVANVQKIQNSHYPERDCSQISCHHHKYRSRKTKRLDESYSLRRQESPRMRKVDSVRTPDTARRNSRITNLR